jgi:hypothetical protein
MQEKIKTDRDRTWYTRQLIDNKQLEYSLSEFRQQPTGLHGVLEIKLITSENEIPLAYDLINVNRLPDRIRISNAAWRHFTEAQQAKLPQEVLQSEIASFCRYSYPKLVKTLAPKFVEGMSPAPPSWLAEGLILKGGGTVLYGEQGRGKSTTALLAAVSVDSGDSSFFNVQHPHSTLFVNLERSAESLSRRLGTINKILGYEESRPLLMLNARGKSLLDLKEVIKESVKTNQVELLVLDSISRTGIGDLTLNKPANDLMNLLNDLCETWIGLGHMPRSGDNLYGSMMFDAACDILIKLISAKQENKIGVGLECTKANDVGFPPTSVFEYSYNDFGLSNVTRSTLSEWPGLAEQIEPSTTQVIEDHLRKTGKSTIKDISEATKIGRSTVSTELAKNGKFEGEKIGRELIYKIKSYQSERSDR